jgi:hypothetical protein
MAMVYPLVISVSLFFRINIKHVAERIYDTRFPFSHFICTDMSSNKKKYNIITLPQSSLYYKIHNT